MTNEQECYYCGYQERQGLDRAYGNGWRQATLNIFPSSIRISFWICGKCFNERYKLIGKEAKVKSGA